MKLDLLSAALISAALLTTPAMARESQVTSERLTANANARTPTGALSTSGQACCRNRARDLPGLADRVGPLGRLLRAYGSRSLGRKSHPEAREKNAGRVRMRLSTYFIPSRAPTSAQLQRKDKS